MTIEEQIAALLATPQGAATTTMQGGTPDYAAYVAANPDLAAEFAKLSGATLSSIGANDKAGYGQWQYDKFGQTEGRNVPITGGIAKTTYADDNSDELALARAVQAARNNAQMNVTGRGLSYGEYGGDIDSYLSNLLSTAPKGLTDYTSYFSPNIADNILGGKEAAQRRSLEQSVSGLFGGAPDYGIFGSAADEILNPQYEAGLQYLDRGMKRGQFNQVGYDSGKTALEAARSAALGKIKSGQDSLLGEYGTKFSSMKTDALKGASGYHLGDSTDISGYQSMLDSFMKNTSASAGSQLKGLFAGQNLIDLGELGQSVGRGQGSVNLHDLDVLDALEKRKKASAVGHGLGSQGAF